jgi:hypothetical protein
MDFYDFSFGNCTIHKKIKKSLKMPNRDMRKSHIIIRNLKISYMYNEIIIPIILKTEKPGIYCLDFPVFLF